jgi:hypothetical protein
MKPITTLSRKQLAVLVLCCSIGQAASSSSARAATLTASGPSALALAAVVASHGSGLFEGKGLFIARVNKITVAADSVVCKMSNVDITVRSCELTFKSHKRNLTGRDANEVYSTLAVAGIKSEGTAGSIIESVTNLACTIDPVQIGRKSGGGATCTFEAKQ